MTKPVREPSKPSRGRYTLGRDIFAKFSAVEGLRLSRAMRQDFREFDRKKMSAQERRAVIRAKYGKRA